MGDDYALRPMFYSSRFSMPLGDGQIKRERVLPPLMVVGCWSRAHMRLAIKYSDPLIEPVQLVSDVVGYGSANALSRAFRAHTGQTPTEWVKHYRQGR